MIAKQNNKKGEFTQNENIEKDEGPIKQGDCP